MALGSPKLCLKHGLQHLKSPDRNVRLEFSVFPLSKGFALEPCGSPKLVMCFFFSGTTLGHPGFFFLASALLVARKFHF